MTVTIVGAGMMGRGIGTRLAAGGSDVELIDHDPEGAQALASELSGIGGGGAFVGDRSGDFSGEIVVLAIYYGGVAGAVDEYRDRLAGKVVVDITNPVDMDTFEGLAVPPDTSAAEQIARRLPDGTPVLKAFNTTFGGTLVAGEVAGQPLDVLIAGDDDAAKEKLASLVEAGGLRAIDVGPLRRARQLEHLGFLHMSIQDRLGTQYGSAVKFIW